MIWKDYSALKSSHAFLSPSKYHWLRYDIDKLKRTYETHRKSVLGTQYHEIASKLIDMGIRQPQTPSAFNNFVNDGIGFRMRTEVVLYYSQNCFGTADAISFDDGHLRIHDLKTGSSNASMDQLMVYAALFVLDYGVEARDLDDITLRIYQNEEVVEYKPDIKEVYDVAGVITMFDDIIEELNQQIIVI